MSGYNAFVQGDMLIEHVFNGNNYQIQISCRGKNIIFRNDLTMMNTKLIDRNQEMTDFVTKLSILVSCASSNNFSNNYIGIFVNGSDEIKKHIDNIRCALFH